MNKHLTTTLLCFTALTATSAQAAPAAKKSSKAKPAVAAPAPVVDNSNYFSQYFPGNKAVNAPNMNFDLNSGVANNYASGAIAAVGNLPIGDAYGFQLDTRYRKTASTDAGGVGGHFYTRDPESYMAGVNALWYNIEGADIYRYGVEGELYTSDLTFNPAVGIQQGDLNDGAVGYYFVNTAYYATDNLKFSIGGGGFPSVHGYYGEVAYQPYDDSTTSFYITAGDSNIVNPFILAGVRFSFGSDGMSMKTRDRSSDPDNTLRSLDQVNMGSITNNHGMTKKRWKRLKGKPIKRPYEIG